MKKLIVVTLCMLFAFGAYLSVSTVDNTVPVATAKSSTYAGKAYVAGMGGHFAIADIVIDPNNKANPITVKGLDWMAIGSGKTHPVHDARIDANDKTKMFWSTYKVDKSLKGTKMHVGLSDLNSGKVLMDIPVDLPKRGLGWSGALYCGSGQTKDSFLPVTMSNESYIDVFDKKTLSLQHRVYLSELGYKDNYFFYHGTNSPDMKTFAVSINMTEKWTKPGAPANRIGKVDMLLLDLPALEKGKVKVLKKNTVSGSPKATLTFRQYFTANGEYLLQSGRDRFYLLDGKTLKLIDEEMVEGENHDAIGTPDSKYAILTLRTKTKDGVDGTLQLYDIKKKQLVGAPVSVCNDCHQGQGMKPDLKKAILCGLDVNWN